MGQVTGFTAERMKEIEDGTIVNADITPEGDLIFTKHDGTEVNVGPVVAQDYAAGGLVKIAGVTLEANAANIDFQSIPTGFAALRLAGRLRSSDAASTVSVLATLNNDTTDANYNSLHMQGIGIAPTSAQNASTRIVGVAPGAGAAMASVMGDFLLEMTEYDSTTYRKLYKIDSRWAISTAVATGNFGIQLRNTLWNGVAAVNRITIAPSAGQWITGSKLHLYGVRPGF